MYYVRSMFKLRVDVNITTMFFNAVILPVLSYGCLAFYGHLSADLKLRLDKPKCICCRLFKQDLTISTVNELYHECLQKFTRKVMADASHPLHDQFKLLPSGRRLNMPALRTSRHRESAVPSAIRLFNAVK